jgi:hypothetical protein
MWDTFYGSTSGPSQLVLTTKICATLSSSDVLCTKRVNWTERSDVLPRRTRHVFKNHVLPQKHVLTLMTWRKNHVANVQSHVMQT